jgi:hypothetical protein
MLINIVYSLQIFFTLINAKNLSCIDVGTGNKSKYSCLDYACLQLCHLGHVKKFCKHTCGLCGSEVVYLPAVPEAPILYQRSDHSAVLKFESPVSKCPIKQIEYRVIPPAKGGGDKFLFHPGKKMSTILGLFKDIRYTVTLRCRSSFGWSKSSAPLTIPSTFVASTASTQKGKHKILPQNEAHHKKKKKRLIARANREAEQHMKELRMRQNQEL